MNFIKKIADKNFDDSVHLQFQKFSRGIFKNRAVLKVKKSKDKFTINAGPEFSNEMTRTMAEKVGNEKVMVTGAIISTLDLTGKVDFKEKKQFQGVKRYVLEKEMTGKEILSLLNESPKSFFGLSFVVNENNALKVKPKAPKSGKPGKGDEGPKADFCKLITNDHSIGKNFVFEKEDFKNADIKHEFVIEKITIPETEEKDFAKTREMAKRHGKIVRYSEIDGVKDVKEYPFEA
ncbi:hypothetical protein COU58_03800 [Candidatus Pacearchaeota archaeon CG10_big_fil_rev_8_21_14_0_10_32_42]|nr:MAG: hypothetical protein COU58_03800 [Candidatus Pacearchaeota archaeon CG10_big_fil_rev_8_21_14_0_10_32_42]